MKYQAASQKDATDEELLRVESENHDLIYDDSNPFWGDSLEIDPERVDDILDSCYKPNTSLHGTRKRRMVELLDAENVEGKRVLDVGCGNGAWSVYLAMNGATVDGFDISKVGIQRAQMIADANDVQERCEFSQQSASDLSYRSKQFDVVFCSNVLHHIWKYDGVQDEIYRVLKDGGVLIFDEGIRSNPVYRNGRNAYRRITRQSQTLGDIDLEYSDLTTYGLRFSDSHIECMTLVSGVKNLFGDDFDNPRSLRLLFRALVGVDRVLESFDALDPYCLEVVGRFKK